MFAPILFALVACTPGPNPETMIEELRLVAAVAAPPEVPPDGATELVFHVADPLAEAPEVLVWAPQLGRTWLPVLSADGTVAVRVAPDAATAASATALPTPVAIWALACAPGVCDIIDRVRAMEPGTSLADEVMRELQDPSGLLDSLPMLGVSLATKRFYVSTRPESARATNPLLSSIGAVPGAEADALELRFDVSTATDVELWGFATSGGFGVPFVTAAGGMSSLAYYPATTSDGELFVVAVQADGGGAVWRGRAAELR